jgi:uncharacterized protein YjbI with pentapeptide repeats
MTLRNWLELLIVPLVIVGIGLLFENQQANRQQAMEEQQQALEERRAEAERELAEQRAQDEALQAYLDQMSGLLLERDLRTSEKRSEVRTLARARTLTVLERLDPGRKTALMRFLVEADLVQRAEGRDPIIDLGGANLSDADLRDAKLDGAKLDGANLSDANLRWAHLSNASLFQADLRDADLSWAFLNDANLNDANLRDANLNNTDLYSAFLPLDDLSDANLNNADLRDANLNNANLSGAEHITNEELEQQAASLEGATMPNGQKYEDWLKGRGEENRGSS